MSAFRLFRYNKHANDVFSETREEEDGIHAFFPRMRLRARGKLLPDNSEELEAILFSWVRVASALTTVVFIIFNCSVILQGFRDALAKTKADAKGHFVPIGDWTWEHHFNFFYTLVVTIHSFELAAMLFFLCLQARIFLVHHALSTGGRWSACVQKCCYSAGSLKNYQPWLRLYYCACHTTRDMTNLSAMKTMRYWNPQVFYNDFVLALASTESQTSGLFLFIFEHALLGLIGTLAFCAKFAHTVDIINKARNEEENGWLLTQFIALAGFANQMFGITQIWRVEENRVLLFLFGGSDATMENEEMARQDAFLAEAARVVFEDMFRDEKRCFVRFFKRVVSLMGLSHFEFQSFTLEESSRQSALFSPPTGSLTRVQPQEAWQTTDDKSELREIAKVA